MECPDCGAFIAEEDMFCGECGRPVEGREPPTEAETQPETLAETVEIDAAPPAAPVVLSPATPPAPPTTRTKPARSGIKIALIAGVVALVLCLCAGGALIWWALDEEEPVTPPPKSLAEPGIILYEDDFGDLYSGWDIYEDDEVATNYVNGEYAVSVYRDYYMAWGNPDPGIALRDFVIDVDIRQVEGPIDNNYGVLLRYEEDDVDDNFYWFQISSDGFHTVEMNYQDEWTTLSEWEESDAINQGVGANNHLQIVSSGDTFSMFVNDTHLVTVSDDTLGAGNIALAAGALEEPGVIVHFDNVEVRSLSD